MSQAKAQAIACPFCGLGCDDLALLPNGVDTRGCAKAAQGFARMAAAREHQVAGRAVSFEDAATAAARILREARLPLITGLSADLDGLRVLIALADKAGAVIDRWQSDTQQTNLAVSQDSGAFLGTFGEIANRADVVLLVGRDPHRAYPRLSERLFRNRAPLYRAKAPWVAFLGPSPDAAEELALAEQLICTPDRFIDVLGTLSALMVGRKPRMPDVAGIPIERLAALVERLKGASYSAIVWDAAQFPLAEGEVAVRLVLHILRLLNRTTRSIGLPLGGNDNALGASQAILWQTGWPSRVSFSRGVPEHDPWLNNAERLLNAEEVDALLWVAAISPVPPPQMNLPTIVIVSGDTIVEGTPDVVLRVGIPGLDHNGTMIRADNVIAVPLTAIRPDGLPDVAAAARAILKRLGGAIA